MVEKNQLIIFNSSNKTVIVSTKNTQFIILLLHQIKRLNNRVKFFTIKGLERQAIHFKPATLTTRLSLTNFKVFKLMNTIVILTIIYYAN